MNQNLTVLYGHCLERLRELAAGSVQCCVTSPPYWGLRAYGTEPQVWAAGEYQPMAGLPMVTFPEWCGELGQEPTPEMFIGHLVAVFQEVRRVLRADGTLWLNLGDSFSRNPGRGIKFQNGNAKIIDRQATEGNRGPAVPEGLKEKDLVGIPWRVALALQADGWWLRSDIIWAKPNCMPESVSDRPTRSHEYLFLLTKSPRYFYDAEAIKEPPSPEMLKQIAEGYNGQATKLFAEAQAQDASGTKGRIIANKRALIDKQRGHSRRHDGFNDRWDDLSKDEQMICGANKRDVWSISPACYKGAHFATFPPELVKPCILAGTSARGACAECGAPWKRMVVKHHTTDHSQESATKFEQGTTAGRLAKLRQTSRKNGEGHEFAQKTETLGWQPMCECRRNDTSPFPLLPHRRDGEGIAGAGIVPCVVLDPFGGSGTTGEVALELGRRAVLIELNEAYRPLIDRRTNITQGLMLA